MGVIIISGVAIGIFLLSLLLSKKHKSPADKLLISYFIFFIASQSYFYFETFDVLQHSPWMLFGRGLYLLGGPLFFYYVYSLTTAKAISGKLYFLTLLPFLLYAAHFLYHYFIGFNEHQMEIRNGILHINGEISWSWGLFTVMFLLSDPIYLLGFYLLLRRFKKRNSDTKSDNSKVDIKWLNSIFYVWAISAIVLFPITILSVAGGWIPFSFTSLLLQIDYVVFIFLVGYNGLRQTSVFSNGPVIESSTRERSIVYKRSGLKSEQAEIYHKQLLELMERKKLYLNGDLTARDLATALGVSANHLSQVLNQKQKQNFFDFINRYRVDEVKLRMQDPQFKNYTLLAIALDSGFNSKTSFNTVFKTITGQTPSQYHKNLTETRGEN